MKVSANNWLLPVLPIAGGILGLGLRLWLLSGRDGSFLAENPTAEHALTLVAIAVPALLLVLTRRMRNGSKYQFNFPPSLVSALGICLGALSIGLYSLLSLSGSGDGFALLGNVLGLGSAGILVYSAWCRWKGIVPNLLLYLILDVYLMVRLIGQFRYWSSDPQLLDYCFQLLATVCLMMTCYHRAAFAIGRGRRRSYALYALNTLFFCCLSLVDWGNVLYYLGIALWMATDLCSLSAPHRKGRFLQEKPE